MTREELKEKEDLLYKYNKAYYEDNTSLVSDKTYDELYKEVENWYKETGEDNYGPTSKVGSSISNSNKLPKVVHTTPMLSLANSYSIEEVKEFLNRYNISDWVAEQKMDGLSVSISYRNGVIIQGATRGDGSNGENVTKAVMEIDNIPSKIEPTGYFEVRGEVLIPKETFDEINRKQRELNDVTYATSRNLASGTLRQLDTSLVKKRGLKFVAYYIVDAVVNGFKTQLEVLKELERLGFEVPTYVSSANMDIDKAVEYLKGNPVYDTDGVVFKNMNISEWTEFTAKTPKWAFAYKYPTEQVETKLLGVTWQVGRTGRIVPVAELEPVVISGTTVSRATLHNMNEINRKDIRVNDIVVVEKAAEIIPQVVGPVVSKRSKVDTYKIVPINYCPECGAPVVTRDSNLYCVGSNCIGKRVESITYFADRVNMNIQGLGRSTVEKLCSVGLLTDIPSIYSLKDHREALIGLDKLSEKSVDNLLAEIEKSRQNSFGKLLGSLGIDGIGRTTGMALTTVYPTWEELFKGAISEFDKVKGVGRVAAQALYNWMVLPYSSENVKIIEKYLYKGKGEFEDILNDNCKKVIDLHIGENSSVKKSGKLNGLVFGFTGKLPVSRQIISEEIMNNGGLLSTSISKNLNYIIVGLNPTSHKISKAKELGIKMISYEQFNKMV